MKNTLGRMNENVIGYNECVADVERILRNSGRLDNVSDVVRTAIAAMIWSMIAPGNSFRMIYEHDLDHAIEEIEAQLKKIY